MASVLDTLIARVGDAQLRSELGAAAAELRRTTDFGLVFERHLPETLRLPRHTIRRGVKVAPVTSDDEETFEVVAIKNRTAKVRLIRDSDGASVHPDEEVEKDFSLDELVVVAEFGDPIYPGLRRLGSVEDGSQKPAHIVINGENFHALEALQFTHAGKVDCIYIDPPYNSRARDWKYNNDYVDRDDAYKHSKWLAFMNRRLRLAKKLLNPDDSVLIVTIDEKEFSHLGMLLEKLFPGAKVQMVTTVISAKGTMRKREFSRVDEHIFFVLIGETAVIPWDHNMLDGGSTEEEGEEVEWLQLRRREPTSTRASRPNQFYPILVSREDGAFHSIGDSLEADEDRRSVESPPGTIAFWPINTKGIEMVWGLTPESLRKRSESGYFRLRNWNPQKKRVSFQYLPGGTVEGIESGRIALVDHDDDGAVRAYYGEVVKGALPKTVWKRDSHNAEINGTILLSKLLPGRRFPYPKSLYAVEDTLRFFVADKPDAVVLDFFAGSGTTAHAVARLNRQDGGSRQSITITNNEVSAGESAQLREQGYRPGDPEWEALGIYEHITRPRITAAMTGATPEGIPVEDDYGYTDEFPMSEGFPENIEFFELTYQDAATVELDMAFEEIAPLLWLRAGGLGSIIESNVNDRGRKDPYAWTDTYGVLFDTDNWQAFVSRLPKSASTVFIVTDSATEFAQIVAELPSHVRDQVRLYERYLTSFELTGQLDF